ncbi:MAG TPA: prepilin-type N-terminal cleavage/methylation domain-containing protein, partial [Verrucomicrobiae bacterium]|nr:prepilin-type N-terminal cleavage/methylation domain-containing protein [Verrucomicrobiae bacterium]
MKILTRKNACRASQGAFTLVEAMVSSALLLLIIGAVLTCHTTGLCFNLNVQSHVQNVQSARDALSCISEEVQSANSLQVGTGTASHFVASTNLQQGNALRIYPSTNTNQYIYYYYDSGTSNLNKIPLYDTNIVTVATAITNSQPFSLQTFSGTILTNNSVNSAV